MKLEVLDSPADAIRQRLPSDAVAAFDDRRARFTALLPLGYRPKERDLMLGFVAAAWVLGEHRRGTIQLDARAGRDVSNMGTHCANLLRNKLPLAIEIVHQLTVEGVVNPAD